RPTAGTVSNVVPLPEILAERAASGLKSQVVERSYDQAIAKLGAELTILQTVPVEDIAHAGWELLAEAITRLRSGRVICDAGYDGEYGVIRLFEDSELKRLTMGSLLFEAPASKRKQTTASAAMTTPHNGAPAPPQRPRLRIVRAAAHEPARR